MTTIAYRDGVLAADSLLTFNTHRDGAVTKIVLRAAIDFHALEAEVQKIAMADAAKLKEAAESERDRAARVIANIEKMIGLA